ncbi:MAG: hypothetical protein WCO78_04650 [Candidatus Roizmanbacteria bacterium]
MKINQLMTDLLLIQTKLQNEAIAVVEKLNLRPLLGRYGHFTLVGSIVYGLMTWRDIDINLIMPHVPTDTEYSEISRSISSLPQVVRVTHADNRQLVEADRPRSMYLGIRYMDDAKNIWKIDVRLLTADAVTTDRIADLIEKNITDESRRIILDIKSQVHDDQQYHKAFSSVDIYEAVLIHGVTDIDGFTKYLLRKNITV